MPAVTMALAGSPSLHCMRTQSPAPVPCIDFVSRQAQKISFRAYSPLCLPSSRAASILAARWLADSSRTSGSNLSYHNVMMQVHAGPENLRSLAAILLCNEKGLVKMARRFPDLFSMDPEEVFGRLIELKTHLPNCNVAGMVQGQPLLFLGRPCEEVTEQVAGNYSLFSAELPLLDVDTVVQEKPGVLFISKEMLLDGLPQLRSMTHPYAADSTTVANLIWATFGRALEDLHNQIL